MKLYDRWSPVSALTNFFFEHWTLIILALFCSKEEIDRFHAINHISHVSECSKKNRKPTNKFSNDKCHVIATCDNCHWQISQYITIRKRHFNQFIREAPNQRRDFLIFIFLSFKFIKYFCKASAFWMQLSVKFFFVFSKHNTATII